MKKLKFWQNFSLLSNFTKNKLFPVEKGVVMTSFPVNLTQKSDFRSNPTQNQKFLKKNSHFYHMWKNFVILKKLTHVKTRAEIFLNKIINFLKISFPPPHYLLKINYLLALFWIWWRHLRSNFKKWPISTQNLNFWKKKKKFLKNDDISN